MDPKLARCGIYCGQCTAFLGVVAERAAKLKQLIERDFKWSQNVKAFDYQSTVKGLEWLSHQKCPGCRFVSETWCEVKKNCPRIKSNSIDNCLQCEEFPFCQFNEYQRSRYSYLLNDYKQIHEIGMERYLQLQEMRSKNGIRIQDIRDW